MTTQTNKKNKSATVILLSTVILFSIKTLVAHGAQGAQEVSRTKIEKTESSGLELKTNFSIEYSQAVLDQNNAYEKNQAVSFTLNPVLKLNERFALGTVVIAEKSLVAQKETSFADIPLQLLVKGFQLTPSITTAHKLSVVAPVSDESVKTNRLKTKLSLSNKITYKNDLFDASYILGLTKNFHEYTVNADNEPNIEYILTQGAEVNLNLTDIVSVSLVGNFKNAKTYENFDRSSFEFSADMNFQLVEFFAVNVGTTNEGSALKANGRDSNLKAFDENSSVYRLGLNFIF